MNSVVEMPSSLAIEGLLLLVKASEPILDPTYGSGTFWQGTARSVFGCDIDPTRAKDLCADFRHLPMTDKSYPTVVYDPPFHPYVNSREEIQFKGAGKNEKELKVIFQDGLRECWRITSRHLIVKCQGFVHNHRPQWMPLWAIDICGEPFEWLIVSRKHKVISGRWKSNNSLRRNHAEYLVFDKKGNLR